MAVNRAQIVKELEPGLNAVFGEEYNRYEMEHTYIFDSPEKSNRAFEEEVLFTGFEGAPTKAEGASVTYDEARESYVSRYNMETIALAFALTEESLEDNLYESLSMRLSKSLARSMAHTKQVKAANVLNKGFTGGATQGGDGVALFSTAHPLVDGSTASNKPTTDVDLSEAALEDALIAISNFVDDRGIPIAVQARKLCIPPALIFIAQRILQSPYRVDTANNDINAIHSLNMFPGGYGINHRLTDSDAWYIITDAPDGLKHFERVAMKTSMEGDFETGNVRYKARERYVFGWSDWRGAYASEGG
jgi:hypothetical protein